MTTAKRATANIKAEPRSVPPTLSETQALFQKAVLEGDSTIFASLCDNSRTSRTELFGVYQNAYTGRLAEILAQDYEYLSAYLGGERFAELAEAYIAARPSRSQNARWFGARLPAFLRSVQTHEANPEYADLADLEKALADAFDAADADPLTLAALQQFSFDDWGRLVFQTHPSSTLLTVESDAFTLWKSLKADADNPEIGTTGQRYLVTWRQAATPMVREMGNEEAMMWIEAGRGVRFDALCELLATYDDPDNAAARAAGYLQGWLTTEMLCGASLAAQS